MHGLFGHMQFSDRPDTLLWRKAPNGSFTNKGFYDDIRDHGPKIKIFKLFWKPWIPYKVAAFNWKVFHRAIPTDDKVRKLGIPLVSRCYCCSNPREESLEHLLFRGEVAQSSWSVAAKVFDKRPPSSLSKLYSDWFLKRRKSCFMDNLMLSIVQCLLWEIWLYRKQMRLENLQRPVIKNIKRWAFSVVHLVPGQFNDSLLNRASLKILGIAPPCAVSERGIWHYWRPFQVGLTLSMVSVLKDGKAFAGGIVRDHNGGFVMAIRTEVDDVCLFLGILSLLNIIENNGVDIDCIQSSHCLFDCITNPRLAPPWNKRDNWRKCLAKGDKIKFLGIHKELNVAAEIIAYNGSMGSCVRQDLLPKAAKMVLSGADMPVLCSK